MTSRVRQKVHFLVCTICLILQFDNLRQAESTVASPWTFRETNPDGSVTSPLRINGNPEYQYMSDEDDYPVVLDGSCFYVYAKLNSSDGTLMPSAKRVGEVDPEDEGFQKGVPHENTTLCSGTRMCIGDGDGGYSNHSNRLLATTDRKLMSGIQKNLVLLVRFADHVGRQLPTPADVNILFNQPRGHPSLAPTGSIRDVFLKNSYGQLDFRSEAFGWVTLPRTEAYYADGRSGLGSTFLEALGDALSLVERAGSIDFRSFDADNDGVIDTITLLHSSYAAEWGSTDAYGASMYDRIWSHKWGFSSSQAWRSTTGIQATNYVAVPALWGTGGSAIGRIGVIAHEIGHIMGLPDLYGGIGGTGIGSYGMMANSWGFDGTQFYPPMMSPWSKIQLSWMSAVSIKSSGSFTIEPSALVPQVYRIDIGSSSSEYLLIENRQALEFDAKLPRGGLCIWHIDEKAGHRDAGFPGDPGWPVNDNHYRVSLVQADGEYDLERGNNRGDSGDVFHSAGVNALRPSDRNLSAGPFPNTDAYQDGIIVRSGITIYDISPSGTQMQFSVALPGSPVPSRPNPPTQAPVRTPPIPRELRTTFAGGNGAAGSMIDIFPRKGIVLFGMDIQTNAEERVVVEVWTKPGSLRGFERNSGAWTRLVSTEIQGRGRQKESYLEIPPLRLVAKERQALYITIAVGTGLRYTDGNGTGTVYASNSDLDIIEGVGKTHPFGRTILNRQWNGVLHYYLSSTPAIPTNPPTPAPTPQPTFPPTSDFKLETVFVGGTEQAGNMFDLLAFQDVSVTGFDIHSSSTGQISVEIYTKSESHVGFENNCAAWTMVARVQTISRGFGTPTPLPPRSFPPIRIRQFRVQAFYIVVTSSGGTRGLFYTRGTGRGTLVASDDKLAILEGVGLAGRCGRTFSDRTWNGVVRYDYLQQSATLPPKANYDALLQTTFVGGKQAGGNMFVVTALRSLSIVEMSVHVDLVGQTSIEIFTRPGTYDGFENNPVAWVQIVNSTIVSNGRGEPTPIPSGFFDPIVIESGASLAFYVTLTTEGMRYTDGDSWNSSVASNSDMIVSKGIGVVYPYGRIYQDRVWNGVLNYNLV